jgi:hypothetical protein
MGIMTTDEILARAAALIADPADWGRGPTMAARPVKRCAMQAIRAVCLSGHRGDRRHYLAYEAALVALARAVIGMPSAVIDHERAVLIITTWNDDPVWTHHADIVAAFQSARRNITEGEHHG